MGRLALAALLAGTALSHAAYALDAPKSDPTDPNMRHMIYRPGERTLIIGTLNRSTTITVCPTESIVRVIFGDQGNVWEGPDPKELGNAPIKNNLPIWAKKVGATNLQIIATRPDGSDRVYQFATVVREGTKGAAGNQVASTAPVVPDGQDTGDDPDATYGLVVNCAAEIKAAATTAAQARWAANRVQVRTNAQLLAAKAQLQADADGGNWNVRYFGLGSREIEPAVVRDNGEVTEFTFPGNQRVPAVYAELCKSGNEQTIPFAMNGDRMVVQRTAKTFCLRLGQYALDVINLNWNPVGQNPGTGTTSPNVLRVLKAAAHE